jgi:hypothetical protein
VAFSSIYGLIFPYLPYVPLRALSLDAIHNAERLIGEILEFFEYAREREVEMELLGHCQSSGAKKTRLIDVVDLNVSNVLIDLEEGEVLDWSIVDCEYVGNQNRARNEKNLAAIMEMFGYNKEKLIVKNPLRTVLKRTPYWSQLESVMDRIPLYTIVDGARGQGCPRVRVLENQSIHLLKSLIYCWRGGASIEEKIFSKAGVIKKGRFTRVLRKLRKKARRVVGIRSS